MKTSREPYDLDSSSAVNGVLPQGAGFGNAILATLSWARSSSSDASSFSARFSICCAAAALVALARILFAWSTSWEAFFSAFARSRLRRRSSVSRWVRYAFQPTLYTSISARFASRWNTRVTVSSSRPTSWLIMITPPGYDFRKSRSHTIESASRWFVGSSSSSVSACANRIRASSTRRR